MSPITESIKSRLKGLNPEERARLIAELAFRTPAFDGAPLHELESILTPQEYTAAALTLGALGVGAIISALRQPKSLTAPTRTVLPLKSVRPPKRWHKVLQETLKAIEVGASALNEQFNRKELPEGVKQFHPLLKAACVAQSIKPPTNSDTVRRVINNIGWGFAGGGIKKSTGSLKRLARAGGLTI